MAATGALPQPFELRLTRAHKIVILAVTLVVAVFIANACSFVQDDAYISFRYAKNLVDGYGLVYNVGGHTEGYTNLLWTLMIALPIKLGFDPAAASIAIGLAMYPFTLTACFLFFRRCLGDFLWSMAALLVVITNFSFASYATGGLETQMQILLLVGCALATVRLIENPSVGKAIILGGAASLALLCRLDSAVILLACYGLLAARLISERRVQELAIAIAVPAATLIVWSLWRHHMYGAWLPNTAAVKVHDLSHLGEGLEYWWTFILSYGSPIVLIACPIVFWRARSLPIKLAAASSTLWVLYVVAIGGDFMEYRMGAVVYPFLVAVLFAILAKVRLPLLAKLAVPVVLIAASYIHSQDERISGAISSIRFLRWQVDSPLGWVYLGKYLGNVFGTDSKVVIATSAAGAIPYYSNLRTVDMLGLNDSYVTAHGRRVHERVGHEVKATFANLRAEGVNLIIANPELFDVNDPTEPGHWIAYHFRGEPDFRAEAAKGNFVFIPVANGIMLVTWYLVPSPQVDGLIREYRWPVIPAQKVFDQWSTDPYSADQAPPGGGSSQ